MSSRAGPTLLVGEDDDMTFELIRLLSSMQGLRVVRAMTGKELLLMAASEKPDLILADVILADGIATPAIRVLLRGASTRDIPVIAMSSLYTTELREAAASAGCREFVEKPFKVEELRDRLRRWVPAATEPSPRRAPPGP